MRGNLITGDWIDYRILEIVGYRIDFGGDENGNMSIEGIRYKFTSKKDSTEFLLIFR